jgi:hypothetical protein
MWKYLLLYSYFLQIYAQSSDGKVFGIGYGTLIIIISIFLAIIICILARSTSQPELYSFIGILIPIFFILLFVLMPKQSQQKKVSEIIDSNYVPHIVFTVISLLMFVINI